MKKNDKMRMPAFSAEASLYQTSGYYRMVGAPIQAEGAIQLAAIGGSCWKTCMQEFGTNDPFASEDCKCICYGQPFKNCWPI